MVSKGIPIRQCSHQRMSSITPAPSSIGPSKKPSTLSWIIITSVIRRHFFWNGGNGDSNKPHMVA
ncbi:hypothetical protein QJS10_CPB17g01027 [Acorus calamus]|uniref:Uncharacterized protein n=1 Tax=Acorus calamus TaxID=4465 RepID=A0AAV9CVU8_ACOCL|nr:hypothetical protein QJS10_CPB17g01027 [Acorus calamus]